MPTYANAGTTVQLVGLLRLEPGQTGTSLEFVKVLPTNVTQTLTTPFFDPIVSSEKVTGNKTITIDTSLTGNYRIKIYVSTGDVSVYFNSGNLMYMGAGDLFDVQCQTRIIDTVTFVISSGTAYITVLKI